MGLTGLDPADWLAWLLERQGMGSTELALTPREIAALLRACDALAHPAARYSRSDGRLSVGGMVVRTVPERGR